MSLARGTLRDFARVLSVGLAVWLATSWLYVPWGDFADKHLPKAGDVYSATATALGTLVALGIAVWGQLKEQGERRLTARLMAVSRLAFVEAEYQRASKFLRSVTWGAGPNEYTSTMAYADAERPPDPMDIGDLKVLHYLGEDCAENLAKAHTWEVLGLKSLRAAYERVSDPEFSATRVDEWAVARRRLQQSVRCYGEALKTMRKQEAFWVKPADWDD